MALAKEHKFNRERLLLWVSVVIAFVLLIAIYFVPESMPFTNLRKHYLPVHTLLEFAGILASFAIFTLGWATYRSVKSTKVLVISVASMMAGYFDVAHTLSFAGMPDFVTPSGPNKAIYFWLASRLTTSIAFAAVAFFFTVRDHGLKFRKYALLTSIVWVFAVYWLVLFSEDKIPVMFIPGEGLTSLKVILEWLAILLSLLAAAVLIFQISKTPAEKNISLHWLAAANVLLACAGLFFTWYRTVDDLYNFAGHVYKAIGFGFIYRAVFIECVTQPYGEMKDLAVQASEASTSKGRFLANVSHELRTPLGVITGFSELLSDSGKLEHEEKKWVDTIRRNSDQLRFLIDDLLDLSKAESEKVTMTWSRVSAAEVVESVVTGLRLQAEKKGIELLWRIDSSAPAEITTDALRFRQVLTNVIGNAVKFTQRGKVEIEISGDTKTFVRVRVRDTGIGIEPSRAKSLFQPFVQADEMASRRLGGTGLGLALSRKITQLLGGDLLLEKSTPNQGSVFVFEIRHQENVELSGALNDRKVKADTLVPNLEMVRILAAEDSADNQFLLSRYLQPTSSRLVIKNNGREALQYAQGHDFDLVLMDIQMPEMDGFEAVLRIREMGWQGPIIALSAHAHQPERERALKNGFNDYLVKPFSKDELWSTITKNLRLAAQVAPADLS